MLRGSTEFDGMTDIHGRFYRAVREGTRHDMGIEPQNLARHFSEADVQLMVNDSVLDGD